MPYTKEEIAANRDYFIQKLNAEKQRNAVLKAVQNEGPFDFVLVDTRGSEAFASGHIPGAICGSQEDLAALIPTLPKDKEIVTYCWGHD